MLFHKQKLQKLGCGLNQTGKQIRISVRFKKSVIYPSLVHTYEG